MSETSAETMKHPMTRDLEERIRDLKQRATALAGEEIFSWCSDDTPPDVLEQFWEHVVAYEETVPVRPYDLLIDDGLELPAGAELDDEALSAKLRELVEAMARRNMYVLNTNHLSDRELYVDLMEEELLEEIVIRSEEDGLLGVWIIDMIGSGSEEDVYLDLKYYADEEQRRRWSEQSPEDEIPEREDPPYSRDETLPQPSWGLRVPQAPSSPPR